MTAPATSLIVRLTAERDSARDHFFALQHPGNLTPAQELAFTKRVQARMLELSAAQIELDAEKEMETLLALEKTA